MSKIFFTSILLISISLTLQSLKDDIDYQINSNRTNEKTLSRKRRYLIFPEGSSLQLVYCLTIPSLGVGSIFTIGSTAALAWELPHEPFGLFFKKPLAEKRIDKTKESSWSNKKTITLQDFQNYKQKFSNDYYHQQYQMLDGPITTYSNPFYHEIHRRTRRDLYGKLEKFFTAFSTNGKKCVLKYICEVSQRTKEKGTFMEEIIKAIFRVRHEEDYNEKDEYDKAANKEHNCTEIYPECNASLWSGLF